jgi:gluconate 2-dehydrogenase gamma chain
MISRRRFAAVAGVGWAAKPAMADSWRVFSDAEAKLVDALADQVVPADDAPSARQAGVIHYIDTQLDGPLRRFAPAYRQGLVEFEAACRERAGSSFLDLGFDKGKEFLRTIERGDVSPSLATFFAMVIDHTMQGFYGSPKHGGNRDGASWKMLDIEEVMSGGPGGNHP